MNILVGHTGLIGSSLKEQSDFDMFFNSKNIKDYDKLVTDNNNLWLTCLPATKWLVNQNIKQDIENIEFIIKILSKKKYNNIFLFSTIDVYNDSPLMMDEDYYPNVSNLNYGNNRYFFELLVNSFLKYNKLKIFRLPAVFNKNIKKNILFDLIHNNNVHKIKRNSTYQWYNLNNLYSDVLYYDEKYINDKIFNLFTEPIKTSEILNFFPNHYNKVENNEIPIEYNYTTKFSNNGYTYNKSVILKDLENLINEFGIK